MDKLYFCAVYMFENNIKTIGPAYMVEEDKVLVNNNKIYQIFFDDYNIKIGLYEDVLAGHTNKLRFHYFDTHENRALETWETLTGIDFSRTISIAISDSEELILAYKAGLWDYNECIKLSLHKKENNES